MLNTTKFALEASPHSLLSFSPLPLRSLGTAPGRKGLHMVHRVLNDRSACALPLNPFTKVCQLVDTKCLCYCQFISFEGVIIANKWLENQTLRKWCSITDWLSLLVCLLTAFDKMYNSKNSNTTKFSLYCFSHCGSSGCHGHSKLKKMIKIIKLFIIFVASLWQIPVLL